MNIYHIKSELCGYEIRSVVIANSEEDALNKIAWHDDHYSEKVVLVIGTTGDVHYDAPVIIAEECL